MGGCGDINCEHCGDIHSKSKQKEYKLTMENLIKTFTVNITKQTWEQAVSSVGDTPKNYDVWKVGDQYKLPKLGERELVLVNGIKSFEEAIKYAKDNQLNLTSPYEVFALKINFEKEFGNHNHIVATQECTFGGYRQACYVWWHGESRGAYLAWLGFFGHSFGWFAFSKEDNKVNGNGESNEKDLDGEVNELLELVSQKIKNIRTFGNKEDYFFKGWQSALDTVKLDLSDLESLIKDKLRK